MDTKVSGILGVCLIIAALIVALVPRPATPAPPGPRVGRYQVGGAPGHAYVTDTATGQVRETFATATEGSSDPEFKRPKVR